MYVRMKSNVTLSCDSATLSEARLRQINLSNTFEEALKQKLGIKAETDDITAIEFKKLKEIHHKVEMMAKSGLEQKKRFDKAVFTIKLTGMPTKTNSEKIAFWEQVLKEYKQIEIRESTPTPPKEKGVI